MSVGDGKQSRTHTCVDRVNSGGSTGAHVCVCVCGFVIFFCARIPDGCGAAGKRRRDVGG